MDRKISKEDGLHIIIQCNMKIVNSFDVTFSLNEGIYKFYTKPNNEIKYIQKDSNHLPSVFGQTPLSFNEKKFQGAVPSYQKAL